MDTPLPVVGATWMVKLTGCPCWRLAGERLKLVVVGVKLTDAQFFMRFATFTDPSPVAKS